jgi:hypothetical protein
MTRLSSRDVPVLNQTSLPRRLERGVFPTDGDLLGPHEAPTDRPHHPQLLPD